MENKIVLPEALRLADEISNVDAGFSFLGACEEASLKLSRLYWSNRELVDVLKAFPGFTDNPKDGQWWIEQARQAVEKATGDIT